MRPIDKKALSKFLELAGSALKGNWIVIGGTVLPLIESGFRTTVDIDIVGFENTTQKETLLLMGIAEKIGLPVEAINQAGSYFLNKIKDWKDQIVLIHQGPNAKIYRPDVNLFVQLKIGRMNESDLADCIHFLKLAPKLKEPIDSKSLSQFIRKAVRPEINPNKKNRLQKLLEELERLKD